MHDVEASMGLGACMLRQRWREWVGEPSCRSLSLEALGRRPPNRMESMEGVAIGGA